MQTIEAIGLGAVGVLAVVWFKNRAKSHQVVTEAIPTNSSDFQGSMWTMLNGADMPCGSGDAHRQMTNCNAGVSKAAATLFELNAMVKPMKTSPLKNLDGSNNADPGFVGQKSLGLVPSWNGAL